MAIKSTSAADIFSQLHRSILSAFWLGPAGIPACCLFNVQLYMLVSSSADNIQFLSNSSPFGCILSRLSDDNIAFMSVHHSQIFEFIVLELDHALCTPCSPFLIHHFGKDGRKTFVGGLNLQK